MGYPNIFPLIPRYYFFNDAVGVGAGATTIDVTSDGNASVVPVILYMHLVNTTNAPAYLQMYGSISAVTVIGVNAFWVIRLNANESREINVPLLVGSGFGFASIGTGFFAPASALSIAGTTSPSNNVGANISVQMMLGFLRLSPTGGFQGGD